MPPPLPRRPWGVTRAAPVVADVHATYASVRLDAGTQVACYRDPAGHPVEATGHKHEGTTRTVVHLETHERPGRWTAFGR